MSSRQALELERSRLAERLEEQPQGRIFAPLADVHRKLGDLDTALELCLTGLSTHPRYSSAHLILGKVHLDRGDDEAAREAFERVLELDPENLLALRQLADLYEASSDYDRAEELWTSVASIEPSSEEPEQRLAWIRARREREASSGIESPKTESGTRSVGEATAPEDPDAAEAETVVGVEREADASARNPGVPTTEIATMTLAEIYAEQGFRAKALEIYRQIEARNPSVAGLHDRIAAIETDLAKVEHSLDGSRPGPANQADLEDLSRETQETVLAAGEPDREAAAHHREVRPSAPLTSPTSAESEEVAEAERFGQFRGWLDRMRAEDDD